MCVHIISLNSALISMNTALSLLSAGTGPSLWNGNLQNTWHDWNQATILHCGANECKTPLVNMTHFNNLWTFQPCGSCLCSILSTVSSSPIYLMGKMSAENKLKTSNHCFCPAYARELLNAVKFHLFCKVGVGEMTFLHHWNDILHHHY